MTDENRPNPEQKIADAAETYREICKEISDIKAENFDDVINEVKNDTRDLGVEGKYIDQLVMYCTTVKTIEMSKKIEEKGFNPINPLEWIKNPSAVLESYWAAPKANDYLDIARDETFSDDVRTMAYTARTCLLAPIMLSNNPEEIAGAENFAGSGLCHKAKRVTEESIKYRDSGIQ